MSVTEKISLLEQEIKKSGIMCDVAHMNQVVKFNGMPSVEGQEKSGNVKVDGSAGQLQQEITYLKQTSYISAYRPLYSCRPIIGSVIVFVKKVIRKLVKFYVEPITFDQSDRNAHMARALELLQEQLQKQTEEIEQLKRKLS